MTSNPITFNVDKIGEVLMAGTGPWKLRSNGAASQEILDSTGAVANPTVIQTFGRTGKKPNKNVIFASRAVAQGIVDTANAKLEKVS